MDTFNDELDRSLRKHPYYSRLQEELTDHYEDALHDEMLLGANETEADDLVKKRVGKTTPLITAMKQISKQSDKPILFAKAFFISFLLLLWSQFIYSFIVDNLIIFMNSGSFSYPFQLFTDITLIVLLGYLIVALFTLLHREYESRAYRNELMLTSMLLPGVINILFLFLLLLSSSSDSHLIENAIGHLSTIITLACVGFIGWKGIDLIYRLQDEQIAGKSTIIQKIQYYHEMILLLIFSSIVLIQLFPFQGQFAEDFYPYIENMQWLLVFPFQVVAIFLSLPFDIVGLERTTVRIYLFLLIMLLLILQHLRKAWHARTYSKKETVLRIAVALVFLNCIIHPIPAFTSLEWKVDHMDVALAIEKTQFGPFTAITRGHLGKEESLSGFHYAAEKISDNIVLLQTSGYRFNITDINVGEKTITWTKEKDTSIPNGWSIALDYPRGFPSSFTCIQNPFTTEEQKSSYSFTTYIICHSLLYNGKEIFTNNGWPVRIQQLFVNADETWAIIVIKRGTYDSNDVYAVALPS